MDINKTYEPFVKYANPGSVESLGWSSEDAQQIRFKVLTEIGIENSDSVLDVGCGYGDFSFNVGGRYLGIDLREHAIEVAKQKYNFRKFEQGDIFGVSEDFDWVIASGIFCFKYDEWEQDTLKTIKKMYELSNKGIAVNFLSACDNPDSLDMPSGMKYVEPGFLIDKIASKVCNKFTLRHDYELKDFTVYFYK